MASLSLSLSLEWVTRLWNGKEERKKKENTIMEILRGLGRIRLKYGKRISSESQFHSSQLYTSHH